MKIFLADADADFEDVRSLIREYAASLEVDLGSQGIQEEIATIPGNYAGPLGTLLLGRDAEGTVVGCLGLRPFRPGSCEIKRLYVRPVARRRGAGQALAREAINFAQRTGYREILLDTLPSFTEAIALYRSLGFMETSPYWDNPLPGTLFFRKRLSIR